MATQEEEMMEALIEAEVERQLARVAPVTPPPLLEEMGRLLRLALWVDPRAQRALRLLVSRQLRESAKSSGESVRGGDDEQAQSHPEPGPPSSGVRQT